jgi:hypothetical protein
MKTLIIVFFAFLSFNIFATITYYPASTLDKFGSSHTSINDLQQEIFDLSAKYHVMHLGSHDTLSDDCPKNSFCQSQKIDFTYDQARKLMFGNLFLEDLGHGKYLVKDVYCNSLTSEVDGVGPDKIPNPQLINCEHTWPQSKFSKNFPSELQKTDLHHLYPADMKANSTRSNNPFADVVGRETHSKCRDSKIGTAIGDQVKSFEPPTEHKGNVARAIYYFSTRYKMSIDPVQSKHLKQWNLSDPVDQEEILRNEKIFKLQGNRNPFIDFPELINRL